MRRGLDMGQMRLQFEHDDLTKLPHSNILTWKHCDMGNSGLTNPVRYSSSPSYRGQAVVSLASRDGRLESIDWDFADAVTDNATHSLHPYPAKFIPQIPRALIEALSAPGETVLDPFCGSGTTLVEAMVTGRNGIGIDASPLACLISRAKTTRLDDGNVEALRALQCKTEEYGRCLQRGSAGTLFGRNSSCPAVAAFDGLHFWFDNEVIEELSVLKDMCMELASESEKDVALTAFSSIIVSVSKQDSDTRYVRRRKIVRRGDTARRFARAVREAVDQCLEFTEACIPGTTRDVLTADVLERPPVKPVDLVVCSPPYPNAYSYHLYHRTRMLWLDMDPDAYKKREIGSHRKYSRKTSREKLLAIFTNELRTIFDWLHSIVPAGRCACFVIGNSIIGGKPVRNADLLIEAATQNGFKIEQLFARRIKSEKKYFNPAIGKIREESIIILRNG